MRVSLFLISTGTHILFAHPYNTSLFHLDKPFSLLGCVNTYAKKSYRGARCNDKLHGEKSAEETLRN